MRIISDDGYAIVAGVLIGIYALVRFTLEFAERSHSRRERFLLDAWRLDHVPERIDAELQDWMLAIIFRHRTGITATTRQREALQSAVDRSDGRLGYRELADHFDHIAIDGDRLRIVRRWMPLAECGFFGAISLCIAAYTLIAPSVLSALLLSSYVLFAALALRKLLALARLSRVLSALD